MHLYYICWHELLRSCIFKVKVWHTVCFFFLFAWSQWPLNFQPGGKVNHVFVSNIIPPFSFCFHISVYSLSSEHILFSICHPHPPAGLGASFPLSTFSAISCVFTAPHAAKHTSKTMKKRAGNGGHKWDQSAFSFCLCFLMSTFSHQQVKNIKPSLNDRIHHFLAVPAHFARLVTFSLDSMSAVAFHTHRHTHTHKWDVCWQLCAAFPVLEGRNFRIAPMALPTCSSVLTCPSTFPFFLFPVSLSLSFI